MTKIERPFVSSEVETRTQWIPAYAGMTDGKLHATGKSARVLRSLGNGKIHVEVE